MITLSTCCVRLITLQYIVRSVSEKSKYKLKTHHFVVKTKHFLGRNSYLVCDIITESNSSLYCVVQA